MYVYMKYACSRGICVVNQDEIAKNIGVKRESVSKLVKKLEDKMFIHVERKYVGNAVVNCIYELLR